MKRPIKSEYQYDHREIITTGGHTTYSPKTTKKWHGIHSAFEYMRDLEKYIDHLEALAKEVL